MSVTFARAQAIACASLNNKVKLQCMPSRSSSSAACIPSHVEATFMSILSRDIPSDS